MSVEQEISTVEIKQVIFAIMEKVRIGEAPECICIIYEKLGPEGFGYWLHGLLSGLLQRKCLIEPKIIEYFKQTIKEN